jgi:hypothetical protein
MSSDAPLATIFGTAINFEALEQIRGLNRGTLEIDFLCTGIDIKIEQKTNETGNLVYAASTNRVQETDPINGDPAVDNDGNPIYVEPPQYEPNMDEPHYVYKVECTIEKHANIDNSLPETIISSLAPFDTGVTNLLATIKTNLRGLIAEEYSTGSSGNFTPGAD